MTGKSHVSRLIASSASVLTEVLAWDLSPGLQALPEMFILSVIRVYLPMPGILHTPKLAKVWATLDNSNQIRALNILLSQVWEPTSELMYFLSGVKDLELS